MTPPRSRAERIAAAKAMFADGVPKRQIARDLEVDPKTIRTWLGTAKKPAKRKPRQAEPADVLLEAALAWVTRNGFPPNTTAWNATRARKAGAAAWQRYLEGWGPRGTKTWRVWPQDHDVTLRFESWHCFPDILNAELERRRTANEPYVPRPVPPQQSEFAALCAHADEVIGKPRDALQDDPITPMFVSSPAGLVDLRGDAVRCGVGIVGDPPTGRSSLLAGVVELDRLRYPPVVAIQRADKPLLAAGLPNSDLIDLDIAIETGCGAIVRSDDPAVRLIAIRASVDASARLATDVCIAVDDADDLIPSLANVMYRRPATAHMAIVWSPQLTEFDTFVWAALPSRAVTTIHDPAVDKVFRLPVEPDLLGRLSLPRPY